MRWTPSDQAAFEERYERWLQEDDEDPGVLEARRTSCVRKWADENAFRRGSES